MTAALRELHCAFTDKLLAPRGIPASCSFLSQIKNLQTLLSQHSVDNHSDEELKTLEESSVEVIEGELPVEGGGKGEGELPMEGGREGEGKLPMEEGREGEGELPMEGGREGEGELPMEGGRDGEGKLPMERGREGEGELPMERQGEGERGPQDPDSALGDKEVMAISDMELTETPLERGAVENMEPSFSVKSLIHEALSYNFPSKVPAKKRCM